MSTLAPLATITVQLPDSDLQRICHTHQWASIPTICEPPACPRCADTSEYRRYLAACDRLPVAPYEPERQIAALRDAVETLQRSLVQQTTPDADRAS